MKILIATLAVVAMAAPAHSQPEPILFQFDTAAARVTLVQDIAEAARTILVAENPGVDVTVKEDTVEVTGANLAAVEASEDDLLDLGLSVDHVSDDVVILNIDHTWVEARVHDYMWALDELLHDRLDSNPYTDSAWIVMFGDDGFQLTVTDESLETAALVEYLLADSRHLLSALLSDSAHLLAAANALDLASEAAPNGIYLENETDILALRKAVETGTVEGLPADARLFIQQTDDSGWEVVFADRTEAIDLTERLVTVSTSVDELANRPYVSLALDALGTEALCAFSGDHTGDAVALSIGERLLMAPVIVEAICGGHIAITLGISGSYFDLMEEVTELVNALKAADGLQFLSVPPAE